MPRGRKPKPTPLKILEGNPGKRPLPENEPKPEVAAPEAPAFLDKAGREEWKRVVAEMIAMKTLARADRGVLVAYCVAWSTLAKAEAGLKRGLFERTKSKAWIQSRWLPVRNKSIEQITRLSAELGLSPASRSRVHAEVSQGESGAGGLKAFNAKRA